MKPDLAPFHSIAQARELASRRLPTFAFDFLDGGAGNEQTIAGNVDHLRALALVPRVLTGATNPDLTTALFGQSYAAPFGIAPMGLPSIAWPGAEAGLAATVARNRIPFVLSSAAGVTISRAHELSAGHAWFQLYPGAGAPADDPRLAEAREAGVEVLILTVDRPVMGWRVRDLTHGVGLDLSLGPRALLSMLAHPRWSLSTLLAGKPRPAYAPPTGKAAQAVTDWAAVSELRKAWPGALVIKGILHPDDARIAADCGADGIVVSNHGGAHLESAVAAAAQLPAIRAAVGGEMRVLVDGGARSGEDIAKMLALGADFVLLGRAFAYAVAAAGPDRGPHQAVTVLREGLSRALTLTGCNRPTDLSADHLTSRQSAFGFD